MSDLPLPEARPDIDAIRERCKAATEGPWEFVEDAWRIEHGPVEIIQDPEGPWPYREAILDSCFGPSMPEADWTFIAAARSDVPALLAYIETLERESGHRVVWSAEEVEPLIEALTAIRDDPALFSSSSQEHIEHTLRVHEIADAALARVRVPEPAVCPTCGSDDPERVPVAVDQFGDPMPCGDVWHWEGRPTGIVIPSEPESVAFLGFTGVGPRRAESGGTEKRVSEWDGKAQDIATETLGGAASPDTETAE